VSNGSDIWLHNDIEDVGGIYGRLYDIVHVGLGHLFQWNAEPDATIEFKGDEAWLVGSTFYLFADSEKIELVKRYECEAHQIALCNLSKILHENNFATRKIEEVLRFVNDYCQTDLSYIINYYKTGEVKNIYSDWHLNSTALEPVSVNSIIIKERSNKCVSLLK
jgi:hypothetical protein